MSSFNEGIMRGRMIGRNLGFRRSKNNGKLRQLLKDNDVKNMLGPNNFQRIAHVISDEASHIFDLLRHKPKSRFSGVNMIKAGINRIAKGVFGFGNEKSRAPDSSWFDKTNGQNTEWHAPNYSYLGPGTYYRERQARGDEPIDDLDRCAMHHDSVYNNPNATAEQIIRADEILLSCIDTAELGKASQVISKFIAMQLFIGKLKLVRSGLLNPRYLSSAGKGESPFAFRVSQFRQ